MSFWLFLEAFLEYFHYFYKVLIIFELPEMIKSYKTHGMIKKINKIKNTLLQIPLDTVWAGLR